MKVGVLLSVGMHPGSGRQRVSHADLSALQLAQQSELPVLGVHAGEFADVLKDYGAYGLRELVLVPGCPTGIARFVAESGINLLVAGCLGEDRFSQGMFPYLVAQALHWPVIPAVVRLAARNATWEAVARLDGTTERRYLNANGCVLVTRCGDVEHMTYAAEQRVRLSIRTWDVRNDSSGELTQTSYAGSNGRRMPQPPWTLPDAAQSARERLAVLRGQGVQCRGRVLVAPTPDEACRQLLGVLRHAGFKINAQPNQGVET